MARVGRTIDPKKVTDLDSWLSAYSLKYRNIRQGENGDMLVLDPAIMSADQAEALSSAKIIPHIRGSDYVDILKSENVAPELRALAESRRDDARQGIANAVLTTQDTFLAAEQQLLEAIDAWKIADSPAMRKEMATQIGTISRRAQEADTAFRGALYPRRYIKSEDNLLRKALNYATMDDRVIEHTLYRLIPETTVVADRVVTVVDTV